MAIIATSPQEHLWLNRYEAAEVIGCSERTIRNYIAQGTLPGYRVKGSRFLRVKRADVEALLVRIPSTVTGGE